MRRSTTLTLTDEELIELQRILLDEDQEGALRFLRERLKDKVKTAIAGED